MVQEAPARGLRIVSNPDTGGPEGAHPHGGLWDDGADPVAELNRVLDVRSVALERFDVDAIPAGQDLASLRRAFVPIWLLHRYQTEASAKALGGVITPFGLLGDDVTVEPVPAETQNAALDVLMRALSVDALTVPERLQSALSFGPRNTSDYSTAIEIMPTAGGAVFDPLRATEIGALQVLRSLTNPERLNRLDIAKVNNTGAPSVAVVVSRLVDHANAVAEEGPIGRRIATTIALSLASSTRDTDLSRALAVQIDGRLSSWAGELSSSRARGAQGDWARGLGALLSDREALDAALNNRDLLPSIPPGSPI